MNILSATNPKDNEDKLYHNHDNAALSEPEQRAHAEKIRAYFAENT